VYVLTGKRFLAGWGIVSEKRCPYPKRGDSWPPVEPKGLDEIARFNRSRFHFRIRDLDDARRLISKRIPVQVSVPTHAGWYKAERGVIRNLGDGEVQTGQHSILLVGYDDKPRQFTLLNSWGPQWGDKGYGYLPYEYFERHSQEAWYSDLADPTPLYDTGLRQPFGLREFAFINQLGYPCLLVDVWHVTANTRVGWCMATVRDDSWFDIEDFFIRPDYQAVPGHFQRLVATVSQWAAEEEIPIRYWIPWIDTRSESSNFSTCNDLIRALKLTVKRSNVTWAPYVAE
jgi:hypothetical protein